MSRNFDSAIEIGFCGAVHDPMTARECLEQLTQAAAIAQQVAHNSEDSRTVRYAKGKHEGLQIALRIVREMEAK